MDKIEIKNVYGKVIFEYECEGNTIKKTVEEAVKRKVSLSFSDLRSSDLRSANLRSANLLYSDLRSSDLRCSDLRSANISHADLRSADIRFSKGINKFLTTPLYGLLDQKGKQRAYKLVNEKNEGICIGGLKYEIGKTIEITDFDANEEHSCGKGINLATLDWCLRHKEGRQKILICEFDVKDIVAIPVGSDGKFRVKKCKVIGEKKIG